METNYISVDSDATVRVEISPKTKELLKHTILKGELPFFEGYLYGALMYWIETYSWKVKRNEKISLADFVRRIQTSRNDIYQDAIINILESDAN